MKTVRDNAGLLFIAIEEGRRKPDIAQMSISVPQMAIEHLSEYFGIQIKNGRMRDINTRAAALAFLSYPYYINLLNGVYGDNALGIGKEEFEVFIDIFAKGIEIQRT
ncbi:MAG: hypothetical protein FIB07_16205 [Candidatus Methanoperedens sp.]|nr:hypothetical protein [Candidatus Methanoperedens sp.]